MDSLATRDPIEVMARAMSADQGFAWEACSQGDWRKDAIAAVKALDEAGFAVVPKLVPRKRDCPDELDAMGYARLVEQLRVKP